MASTAFVLTARRKQRLARVSFIGTADGSMRLVDLICGTVVDFLV
jgi:hypothetical protein